MIQPGEKRVMMKGEVAHIVSSNENDIWVDEALSMCGRLLFSGDAIADDDTPVCKRCKGKTE